MLPLTSNRCARADANFDASDHYVEILALRPCSERSSSEFVSLARIKTTFRAMSLKGDIIAVSDDVNETHIINWRTNDLSILLGSDEPSEHNFQVSRALCEPLGDAYD